MSRGYRDYREQDSGPQISPAGLFWFAYAGLALLLVLGLTGCAQDGGLAGKGRPADKLASIQAGCRAGAGLDAAFQVFATTQPGVVSPEVMATEGALVVSVGLQVGGGTAQIAATGSFCDKNYPGDLVAAETAVLGVIVRLPELIAAWKH